MALSLKLRRVPKAIMACLLAATLAVPVNVALPEPAHAALPDHLINGNFTYPSGINWAAYTYLDILGGKAVGNKNTVGTISIPNYDINKVGWRSTQPYVTDYDYTVPAGSMQIWPLNRGAELAAHTESTIYQDVATTPGTIYRWSLDHLSINPASRDMISVKIGSTSSQAAQPAYRTTTNGTGDAIGYVGTSFGTKAAGANYNPYKPERYTGTYLCPTGQTTTRFAFASVQAYSPQSGNLVNNITFVAANPLLYDLRGGTSSSLIQTVEKAKANNYAGYMNKGSTVTLSSTQPTRAGYTFIGWSDEAVADATNKAQYDAAVDKKITTLTMPATTKTVYAMWMKNPTMTFVDRGVTLKTETVAPGGSSTPPSVKSRDGYVFLNWTNTSNEIWEDTTADAIWDANPYQVIIVPNGGEGDQDPDWSETDAEYKIPDPEITREGYVFDHWTDEEGNPRTPGEILTNLPNGGKPKRTLTAEWLPIHYNIEYNANGGSGMMSPTECVYDEAISLSPCAFEHKGFIFQGWSTTPDGPIEFENGAKVINLASEEGATVTLYAIWEEGADVRICYRVNDPLHAALSREQEDVSPVTGEPEGSTVTPSRGYVFEEWTDVAGNQLADTAKVDPTRGANGLWRAQELIAKIRPAQYRINFDATGGEDAPGSIDAIYDQEKPLPSDIPTRGSREFLGWSDEASLLVGKYQPGEVILNLTEEDGADVVLYAVWGPERYKVTYTDGSGTTLKTELVEAGADSTPPNVPERPGYTFEGWSVPTKRITHDLTVDAIWRQITHTVKFTDGLGNVLTEIKVPHGEAAQPPADPKHPRLRFLEWDADVSCVESDMIVNATWDSSALVAARDEATPQGYVAHGLPQTGDALAMTLIVLLLIAAGGGVCAWIFKRKSEKRDTEADSD